ncbi:hypothetical protein [Paenibacillus contaminans]|uniref:Uncharacterized protein n=1 Tax=Paenibacillus contaminans TaxID=450362 RepID=A0A329MQ53_9BACL|nr:hypothetical protein [Paenibacillus contaminans]RAV21416.1 hypothetical protein DQG23_08990 [Paenibacillus contaminans]
MIENDMLPFALAAGVSIAALQLSVSIRLYRFEKSVLWGCAGIVLLFGDELPFLLCGDRIGQPRAGHPSSERQKRLNEENLFAQPFFA